MDNIIRNLIVSDTIAEHSIESYNAYSVLELYQDSYAYYYLTPWLVMKASVINNIFDYAIKPTIQLLILFNVIDLIHKSKKKINSDDILLFVDEVFLNIKLENYSHYYDIETYRDYKNNKIFNRNINDTFLLEISIVIALVTSNFDDMLKLSSEFIIKISDNDIKKLSFISLSIFMFYAKTYYINNDSESNNNSESKSDNDGESDSNNNKNNNCTKCEKNKWIDLLLDQFLSSHIDRFIKVKYVNKKKFTLMLINYKSQLDEKAVYISVPMPHIRIKNLENIFCDKLGEDHRYIPGSTSDQLLLLSYDFFVTANNWYGNLTNNNLSYCQTRFVNLFSSLFYYITNKNINMHNKFSNINLFEDDIENTIVLFNSFIALN
jgi:hypothetical protein